MYYLYESQSDKNPPPIGLEKEALVRFSLKRMYCSSLNMVLDFYYKHNECQRISQSLLNPVDYLKTDISLSLRLRADSTDSLKSSEATSLQRNQSSLHIGYFP